MVEQIEITDGTDDGVLEVTLRGTAEEVVGILAKGLSREAMIQLKDAMDAELNKRGLSEPVGA